MGYKLELDDWNQVNKLHLFYQCEKCRYQYTQHVSIKKKFNLLFFGF